MGWLKLRGDLFVNCGPQTIRTHHGLLMSIDPFDFVGRHIYVEGIYENECANLILTLLKPGDCFLDVGANIGYFTLLAVKAVGPQGVIHAFEASPRILGMLKTNITLNNFDNIEVHPKFVSDTCEKVSFYIASSDNLGRSGMLDPGDAAEKIDVSSITINSLLPLLPRVKVAKIDVEGAESLVLLGMSDIIARDKPYIIFELTQELLFQAGTNATEVCEYLRKYGYTLYRIDAGLHLMVELPKGQCNVLAVHQHAKILELQCICSLG